MQLMGSAQLGIAAALALGILGSPPARADSAANVTQRLVLVRTMVVHAE
ncbi:MAG: hypothetical protein O7B23_00360 [Deltaproteobacteria bacterium]|nr:hypothetical protein [Deltaproteobacteria bacterium]